MTTYAPFGGSARPVLDLPANWTTTPLVEDSAELQVIEIGKGAPRFQKTRAFTGSVYEFTLDLDTEAEIIAFEDFVTACLGRLNGFWIVYPAVTLQIKTRSSDTEYEIIGGLSDYWSQESSAFLAFRKPGAATQYAKVTAIADTGNNTEIITLDAGVTGVDSLWDVQKLVYARFADDRFTFEFDADNVCSIKLRVAELTLEYAAVEAGLQPVYLYEFAFKSLASPVFYRYAGFDAPIVISGNTFYASAIEHDGHRQSLAHGESETTITATYEAGNPLIRLMPPDMPGPLSVTIYERNYADTGHPDAITTVFTGRIVSASHLGAKITAKAETLLAIVGRVFPRFQIQPRCNYALFSACCRVVQANYRFTGQIMRVGINNLELEQVKNHAGTTINVMTLADDYFSFGWLEYGTGETLQRRTITKAVSVLSAYGPANSYLMLSMAAPLKDADTYDHKAQLVTLYPGCDGSVPVCKLKFNNFVNFGGHVMAPANLSMVAMQPNLAQGVNKK